MPFVKGQSGNPSGGPKKANKAAMLARQNTEAAVKALVRSLSDKSGSVRNDAAAKLLDRGWGKPKEFVELTGEDGDAINVRQLPATDSWIRALLGRGAPEASPISGEDGSVLSAESPDGPEGSGEAVAVRKVPRGRGKS